MASEEVILYSTGCPKCNVLKQKMDNCGISYTVNDSVDEMLSLGITQVPVLDGWQIDVICTGHRVD